MIEGLSLRVEPGQTVAIVGPTGAGKTTLVNLLMRFYEVDSGRILLDGIDVSTMTRHDLRSRMGMVLQDTWLFGGTIAENIAYGRPGHPRKKFSKPPVPRMWTDSCGRFPTDMTPRSPMTAETSAPVRSN